MLTLCSSREAFERIQLLPLKEEARRSEARAVLHLYALRTFESHRDVLEYHRANDRERDDSPPSRLALTPSPASTATRTSCSTGCCRARGLATA